RIEEMGEEKSDQRNHEEADIHRVDVEDFPGIPDEIAEPALGAEHFGDGDEDEAEADTQFDAGHDEGQRTGQRDRAEHLPAARLAVPPDIEIDAVDLKHAGD